MRFNLFSRFSRSEVEPKAQETPEAAAPEEYTGAATLPAFSKNVPLDLLLEDNTALLSGKLTAFSQQELTIRRIPGTIDFPILEPGTRVKVRGYNEALEPYNVRAVVALSNMIECKVRELELIPYDNQRSSFRQVLNVPAAFYAMEDTYLNMPQECRILDISTGGARVASSYRYTEGDVLRLRGELVKGSGYMSFTCKVVRVTPGGNGGFEYGVLFAQLKQRQITDLTNDIRQIQKDTQRKLAD